MSLEQELAESKARIAFLTGTGNGVGEEGVFFVLHGTINHKTGIKRPGELVKLDFMESRYLIEQRIVKRYEQGVDKLAEYKLNGSIDAKGRKLPTLEEYTAAGYSADGHEAFVAGKRAEADAAMGLTPAPTAEPPIFGSKGDGSPIIVKDAPPPPVKK